MKDWIQPTMSVKMGDTWRFYLWGFPGGSGGKESACSAGDPGSVPGSGRSPGERNGWQPTPVFSPGKFCGQKKKKILWTEFCIKFSLPSYNFNQQYLLLRPWHSLLLL